MHHEAILWERLDPHDDNVPRGLAIRCNLCEHRCVIPSGRRGACCVRENRDGALYTLVYGQAIARNIDPIEKKPFFHFQPGSRSYSIATAGCNFHCEFCQNWEISQLPREGRIAGSPASPADVARSASRAGCASVAYTYTEPTIFAEYALDTARYAQELGLKNVFVSNGYMTPELLGLMAGLIDGINVDLKAGRREFYRRLSGASLDPVLANLKRIRQLGIWLEVTTLVIPGVNDTDEELRWMAQHLYDEVGPDTPWHLSRFYPQYHMLDTPPTPTATLERAWRIGRDVGIRYVYVGNVPGHDTESTRCPGCGRVVLRRHGYHTQVAGMRDGVCTGCGAVIAGVDMP